MTEIDQSEYRLTEEKLREVAEIVHKKKQALSDATNKRNFYTILYMAGSTFLGKEMACGNMDIRDGVAIQVTVTLLYLVIRSSLAKVFIEPTGIEIRSRQRLLGNHVLHITRPEELDILLELNIDKNEIIAEALNKDEPEYKPLSLQIIRESVIEALQHAGVLVGSLFS